MINEPLLVAHGFYKTRHVEQISIHLALGIDLWSHPNRRDAVLYFYRPRAGHSFWAMSDKELSLQTLITTGKHSQTGNLLLYREVQNIGSFFIQLLKN